MSRVTEKNTMKTKTIKAKRNLLKKFFASFLTLVLLAFYQGGFLSLKAESNPQSWEEVLNTPSPSSESLLKERDTLFPEEEDPEDILATDNRVLPLEPDTKVYQAQPQVVVEDTPISDSQKQREKIHKILKRAQEETDNQFVNQLNVQRLKHEGQMREKMDGVFVDEKKSQKTTPQDTVANPHAVSPPSGVVAPDYSQQMKEAEKEDLINAVREEISTLKPDTSTSFRHTSYAPFLDSKHYFGGLFNFYTTYPDVVNVDFNWSGGLSLGLKLDDPGFILEGNFLYSSYYLDDVRILSEVDQYNSELFLKYSIFPFKRIRPYGGVGLSYTVRKYYDVLNPATASVDPIASISSHAVDMGVLAGVDMFVQRRMSIGIEYRYYYNINYESDGESLLDRHFGRDHGNVLEKQNYSLVSLIVRFNF